MEVVTSIEDDFGELEYAIASRERRIRTCTTPEEAAAFYHEGEELERTLRAARARILAERGELYQTGFLLRALAADLPVGEKPRHSLDIKA